MDAISAFPLYVITIVNSIYLIIVGKDSGQAGKAWTSCIILLLMRFVTALVPFLVAMAVSNLVTILMYSGLISFFLAIFIPFLLQLRSQWVCRKTFKKALEPRYELEESSTNGVHPDTEEMPLLNSSFFQANSSALYMTPYSTIFSYWPAVVIIGGVGVALFVLTVASFFS